MTPRDDRCRQTDLVLARFLDGDPTDGFDPTAHLASCPECQSALRRARRLDALLAQHSTCEVSDALADRLLTGAYPAAVPASRRRLPLALAAAALLLAGVALGMWWRGSPPIQEPATAHRSVAGQVRTGPGDPGSVAEFPGLLPLPDASTRRARQAPAHRIRPPSRSRLTNATLLFREDLATVMVPTVAILHGLTDLAVPGSGAAWPSWPQLHDTARRLAREARVAAGTKLMRSRRTSDHRQFVAFLAAPPASPVRRELLAAARDHAPTVRRLRSALGHGRPTAEVVAAAARVAHPHLDAALRRVVRRRPSTAHAIVEAIVSAELRPHRAAALLDIWDELRARRAFGEPEVRRFESAFRTLPAATTGELVSLATATRRPGRRLQCLTALGWRRDPTAVGFLIGLVDSRHHETALAAGHVLSRMPRAADEQIAARLERSRRPYVLLAALCGIQSKLPRAKLRTVELTEQETAFLFGGAFTAKQFGIACALCRRRSVLSD